MRYHIFAFVFFAASLQAMGQAGTGRVYSSPDPMYKYDIDTAFTLFDKGDYAHAIPFLQGALNITGKSFTTGLKLANAYYKVRQKDSCFAQLNRLCEIHWDLLSSFIDQQENGNDFMFANLTTDARWAGVKQCVKQKHQEYLDNLELAHQMMNEHKYVKAILPLRAALRVVEDKSHLTEMDLAITYNHTGQTDLCFKVLDRISMDWEWMENYLAADTADDFVFANLVHDKRWAQLKARINYLEAEQTGGANIQLLRTMREIQRTDQLYRNAMPTAENPEMSASLKDSLWKLQTTIDSLNLLKVIAIFDEYGYPGDSLVGNKYDAAAWLVIQHSALKYQEKYLPLIKAAAERKQLPMSDVALLIDRIEMLNDRPQIYGSQISCDNNSKCKVYKILDEYNVNKLRAGVGLIPLQDYLSHWGILWAPPKGAY